MEHKREADIEDYWLIQYQRLLRALPFLTRDREPANTISLIAQAP